MIINQPETTEAPTQGRKKENMKKPIVVFSVICALLFLVTAVLVFLVVSGNQKQGETTGLLGEAHAQNTTISSRATESYNALNTQVASLNGELSSKANDLATSQNVLATAQAIVLDLSSQKAADELLLTSLQSPVM
jgi:uncharacterized protein HemX